MDSLSALETWVEPMLAQLAPGKRTRLARSIGTALRRSQHERIQSQRNPDGSAYVPRKRAREKAGRIKRNAGRMFRRISRSEYLKIQANENGVAVGFTGRIARIARVHQDGETDTAVPDGRAVRYPIRELLGFTQQDRDMIRDMLIDHFATR